LAATLARDGCHQQFLKASVAGAEVVPMARSLKTAVGLFVAVLCGAGCSGGSETLDTVDPTNNPVDPTNNPPEVMAGADFSVYRGANAQLDGSATDDGIPGPLTCQWARVSGPGDVVFQDATALDAYAQFDAVGVHILRLTASDGALAQSDEVVVTVSAPPEVVLPYGAAVIDNVSGITPLITITRISGSIPFVVQATAVGSSATWINPDTSVSEPLPSPYDQLHYTWDFGDGTGAETLTHPVSGLVVDADVHQTGPQATFVYRRPGTYTVTLTASIKNTSGVVTQANADLLVTVSGFTGQTQYFDPDAGDDGNNGLTILTPKRSWSAFSDWITGGDNRRAFLKSGTTLVQTTSLHNAGSHTRVEPYGSGSSPIIQAGPTFPGSPMVVVFGHHGLEDQVYSGIKFMGMGRASTIVHSYGEDDPSARDVAFMDCTLENSLPTGLNLVTLTGDYLSHFTFWECHFRHNDSAGQAMYVHFEGSSTPMEFLSVVGGSFLGGDGNHVLDHHIYASGWRRYDLMRWIDFGEATSKNFCLNMNASRNGNNTEYMLIDGCDVTGCSNGIDCSNGANDPALGQFDHFIIQNTAVHDGDSATGYGILGYCVRRLVIRDSLFYGNPRTDLRITDPDVNYQVYRNKFWRDTAGNTTVSVRFLPGQRGTFSDNVLEIASNPGYSQKIVQIPVSEAANYTFEGNQYWCPYLFSGGQICPFYDGDTSQRLTMGQWLGIFPSDGPYADPGFTDPANGIF
jgi:hypothetical protein